MPKLVTPWQTPGQVDQPLDEKDHVCLPLVVITTKEVAFSTVAAVGLPRKSLMYRIVGVFLRSSNTTPSAPHHYPAGRDAFMEDAAMQREMRRL